MLQEVKETRTIPIAEVNENEFSSDSDDDFEAEEAYDAARVEREAYAYVARENPRMKFPIEVLQREVVGDSSYTQLLTVKRQRSMETQGRLLHHSRTEDFFRWLRSMEVINIAQLRETHQQLLVDEDIFIHGL